MVVLVIRAVNYQDNMLTVSIDGIKYEYWFDPMYFKHVTDTVRMLINKNCGGKALRLLKSWSKRVEKAGKI